MVQGHEGTSGNAIADQLVKLNSERSFIGHEPACGIFTRVAKKATTDWTVRDHRKHWICKGTQIGEGPFASKARELLK
jgi:hypothetical protein